MNARDWVFPFVLGAGIGSVVGILVVESEAPPAEPVVVGAAQPTPKRSGPESVPPSPEADDATLAQALELARFDGNWAQVAAVARVLRERVPVTTPGVAPAGEGRLGSLLALDPQGSLLALDHEYRHLQVWLDVRSRDNRATRLLASEKDPAELERRLSELFLMTPTTPEDEVVMADASRLLGWMHREGARRTLLTALQDPSPVRVDLAAQSLSLSRDPDAIAALVAVLEGEREPGLRLRIVDALGECELVPGGTALAGLARAARDDRDLPVRVKAIAKLARVDLGKSPVARDALLNLLSTETEPEEVRLAAVGALREHWRLAKHLPLPAVEELERLLNLTLPPLRLEVIGALGDAGRKESLDRLDAARLAASTGEERAALEDAVARLRTRTSVE